jgi:hypothetical protein
VARGKGKGKDDGGRKRPGKGGLAGDGPISVRLPAVALGVPGSSAVEVGYSAPYAVYVHENTQCRHPNGGNDHFLTGPVAQMVGELAVEAQAAISEGASRRDVLLEAGDALLEASRQQVPVDTGFLRDSGYVQIRRG